MKGKFSIFFVISVLVVFLSCYTFFRSQKKVLTILHTSDNHVRGIVGKNIDYARLATFLDSFRKQHPSTLFVDAGDAIQGLAFSDVSNGQNALLVMNLLGYNAMVPGNHEFDFGVSNFLALTDEANFPIVAMNLMENSEQIPMLPLYIIEEVNGINIAIIGIITPDTPKLAPANKTTGFSFLDPVPILQQIVPDLKKDVDIVVVLAHMGLASDNSSQKLAKDVPGIDIIIDGHDHSSLPQGLMVGNTLIANAGQYGEQLGRVDITLYRKKIIKKKASLIDKEQINKFELREDVVALVSDLREKYAKDLQKNQATVVANLTTKLDGERSSVRSGQTNLTTIVTDAILEKTQADVVFISSGGIRDSIASGEVTEEDINNVMPFGDSIVTIRLSGQELLDAIEDGVSKYPRLAGSFPQLAGILVSVDYTKPEGHRVQSVLVNEIALDPAKMYTIATSTYLTGRGDGYTQFQKPVVRSFGKQKDLFTELLIRKSQADPQDWSFRQRIIDK